jgi:hypothetical protein
MYTDAKGGERNGSPLPEVDGPWSRSPFVYTPSRTALVARLGLFIGSGLGSEHLFIGAGLRQTANKKPPLTGHPHSQSLRFSLIR